jgi:pimeloyl-ACP methyl ester carboxylesterase
VVGDSSQGVPLKTIQQLARDWQQHDWRAVEGRLNALPQFVTEIDGVDIHFIHVRSLHEDALPMIVTHGWPGSVIEQLKIIDPLTDPAAHGAGADEAFHLVIPSLPGHGFSGTPTEPGWDPIRVARALQYGEAAPHTFTPDEQRAWDQLVTFYQHGLGYAGEMANRPQTLYALEDSPVGLAAWMLDHDAANLALIVRVFNGEEAGLSRTEILDNITLYWLTKTAVSSARLYWESKLAFFAPKGVTVPTAVSVFPDEIYAAPQSWAEQAYSNLIHYNQLSAGGHFAAWEQPAAYCDEIRASFRPLRSAAR